ARVHGHAERAVQGGGGRRGAVAAVTRDAVAGDRRDIARLVDLADALIQVVAEVEVARRVDGGALRPVNLGRGGRAAVAAEAVDAGAAVVGDQAGPGCDLPDVAVEGAADVDVARRVDRHALRLLHVRCGRRPAVASVVGDAIACEGRG